MRVLLAVTVLLAPVFAHAATPEPQGELCILPIEPFTEYVGRPGGRYFDTFTIQVGDRPPVQVNKDTGAFVGALPTQQKLRIHIRAGGKPYATFSVRLDPRTTLRFDSGYAQWRARPTRAPRCPYAP